MDCAMNKTAGRCLAALACGVALSVMTAVDGWAQMPIPGMPTGTGNIATGRGPKAAPDKPPEPPPDAVPGAKARQPAAPMTRAPGDLQPTEALFDAINRGDIASARDALNRGADLNGVNVLGMTPMELAVDLGRNDITFLLLSMRGEDGGRGSRAAAHPAAPEAPPARSVQAASVPAKQHVAAARPAPVAAKPVAAPKLFANDGGTPMPNVGFLGFGTHSASD
jgi:hypothetical protein